jgi:hypothetical protein
MRLVIADERNAFEQAGAGYDTGTTEERDGVRRREKAFFSGATN